MKIEWTTIESGKNKTNSKINTILGNKSKFSIFFAENKKHLFWAGISTMAMAFVVWFANTSWTEFSANVVFPSLSNEISETSSVDSEIVKLPESLVNLNETEKVDVSLWDLDLSFDDSLEEKDETKEEKEEVDELFWDSESNNSEEVVLTGNKDVVNDSDETVDLINNLFWSEEVVESEKLEEPKAVKVVKTLSLLENKAENNSDENISLFLENDVKPEKDVVEKNSTKDFLTSVLEDKKENKEASENKNIFKQNNHTVDMNLVSQKAEMKDYNNENEENLHWAANFFNFEANTESEVVDNSEVDFKKVDSISQNEYVVNNTKQLSQSWPWEMLFGLWFLSIFLAYFFRRKKS